MKVLAYVVVMICGIGCSGDVGAEIPASRSRLTEDQIQSMPAAARQGMENAQKAGDYQSQRMAEMAAAQRAAGK